MANGEQKQLQGFVTFAQLCTFLKVSDETLRKKIQPLQPFFKKEKRKRLYAPEEWQLIIEYIGKPVKPS